MRSLFGQEVQKIYHKYECCNCEKLRAKTGEMSASRPALFLDRDGVINVDKGYVSRVEDFEWVPGAAEAIAAFNARNWYVFVVTNQSGIARNYYTESDMHTLHDWMLAELAQQGARIDRIYHCPYHEEGENPAYRKASFDRKPNPGMLLKAAIALGIEMAPSWIVGDLPTDMGAGRNAGLAGGVHVLTGFGSGHRTEALAHASDDFQVFGADSIHAVGQLVPLLAD